ncbi:transcriptional regulator SlrA [Bacillus vallismortis]|uniref:transcriptional regulator SlrA n=1 Tax=Bacillus vallismortis TaxID=72361 RepID=UPI00209040A6|nr:anti-repressor SinI family protein [Bacillus vallismortis]MCO4852634.1 DNA-binding anti-repressor SinI [Bacillus vallismortis]
MKTHVKKDLDKDWHMLMQEARSIGLGIHDVRQFLESETALRKNNLKKIVRQD